MNSLRNNFFHDSQYLEEFNGFMHTVAYSDRNPLNTEMFFLWSMIRATKPKLFIESGTFRGYSANFICEALYRNDNEAEFITFGYNLDNCLPYARRRLRRYPFSCVVETDSREAIKSWKNETRKTAFFIDGPKGRNMPPLFFAVLRNFVDIEFIAVHDCEIESGSGNRWYIEKFFRKEFPIMYCDTLFQEKLSYLDEPLIRKSKTSDWRPYHLHGKMRKSYGTETGYILPKMAERGFRFSLISFYIYRQYRFKFYLSLSNLLNNRRRNEDN